jgi:hypothetical protein
VGLCPFAIETYFNRTVIILCSGLIPCYGLMVLCLSIFASHAYSHNKSVKLYSGTGSVS